MHLNTEVAWQGVDWGPCGTVVLVHHPKASKHIPRHPDPLDCRAPGGFRSGSRTQAALEGRLDQRYPPETRIKGFTVHSSAPKHSRSQNETLASHRRPLRGIKALRKGYFALVGGVFISEHNDKWLCKEADVGCSRSAAPVGGLLFHPHPGGC